jgi:hypothetical protein
MNPSGATPPPPDDAAPRRRLSPLRVLAGLALVAVALGLVLWPRDPRLELDWRLEGPVAGGEGFRQLEEVRPGGAGRILVRLRPGRGAPEGARLLCDAHSRPRVEVVAGGGDLVFARAVEHLITDDDEVAFDFTVEKDAAPGPRELRLRAAAELVAPGSAVVVSAALERPVRVIVGPESGQ